MKPLQIGVCTWSLHMPDIKDALRAVRDELGLPLIHFGIFDESWRDPDTVVRTVTDSGLEVSAVCVGFAGEDYSTIQVIASTGGYVPDEHFEERYAKTLGVADIAQRLGADQLTVHMGFVPSNHKDPKYAVVVERARRIADELKSRGLLLVMETGQEEPHELVAFMNDVGRDNLGVNFDPANMILYGIGDPLEAIPVLKDRIVHVHMKDATWSAKPREEWGTEVVLGTGEANIEQIVSKLRAIGYKGPLPIEREAGTQRVADIEEGISLLKSLVG